ncbi:hypothetical protein [Actinobacillus equuli]|uniref:hypothetical protein n=1 Tax=Actinobacillus equuli TaxID=718 RepID=UPI0024410C43|nr:hypothetical protein [Actinobacillus equuli]WGE52566.1 hypothetical protein NYR69_09010 [Actinobacillus equuli subsp. haemolyticus]WGE73009.1 hypothetical protein NYR80_08735 [Actinobacillus equuli subsp. haemolyticus]
MIILLHFTLALFLFLITNWFGKKSVDYGYYEFSFYEQEYNTVFDLLYKSFSPVVFIFIASLLFHKLGFDSCIIDIYYVVVYSFLIRVTYIIVMGRHSITDWKTIFLISVVSTSISYVVYNEFLLTKEFLIPSKEDIATALWFGFIGYIYKTLNTISNNGDSYEREKNIF